MKETFYNLGEEKQARIMRAVLEEFALSGFDKTSLDAIVRRAGISKGGLYEYIETKEDLFRYALEYSYVLMEGYIRKGTSSGTMPSDPLERTRFISSVAVEFFLREPGVISFIVKADQAERRDMRRHGQAVFDRYFEGLYGDADYCAISCGKDRALALIKWLLVKTRNDFSENLAALGKSELCRDAYLEEWDFFLSVLAKGIYRV
jgi:AcrR family transcriptional regulator